MPDNDWVLLSELVRPNRQTLDEREIREYAKEHWVWCAQLFFIGGWRINQSARGDLRPMIFHNNLDQYRVCKHQAELYLKQRWYPMPRVEQRYDGWVTVEEELQ
jgi:hypothetical protein